MFVCLCEPLVSLTLAISKLDLGLHLISISSIIAVASLVLTAAVIRFQH